MPVIPIAGYELAWNPKTHQGAIVLRLNNGRTERVPVDSTEEFIAVAMILNESPVGINTENGFIVTGWEQVRET